MGFPSPPRVSFPTGDERFAFGGAVGPNLWPRHLRSFRRWLLGGLAAKERIGLIERNGLAGLGSSRRNHAFNVSALFRALDVQNDPSYGLTLFYEVVGVTPEGRYHVRNCDLNAPHLVEERKDRADLWYLLESKPMHIEDGWSLPPETDALKKVVEKMAPKNPYLSGEALEAHRARKKAIAAILENQNG